MDSRRRAGKTRRLAAGFLSVGRSCYFVLTGAGRSLTLLHGSSLIRMLRNLMPGPCPSSPMCPEALNYPGWLR